VNQALATTEQTYSAKLQRVNQQLQEATEKLEVESATAAALKKEKQQILADLENAINARNEIEAELEQSSQGKAIVAKTGTENLRQEYESLQCLYKQNVESTKDEIARLKSANHKLRLELKTRERKVSDLEQSLEVSLQTANDRLEIEKSALRSSYELQVNQLRAQCETQGTDLQRIAALLSESEQTTRTVRAENEKLTKKAKKQSSELKTLKLTTAKEKKLVELKHETERFALEAEYTAKLDELKNRSDSDKRRVYGLGADTFKRFINPTQEIDERSFKSVISQAKKELDRLTASDTAVRRLVSASSNQTTEDAVARLVIGGL
jgi:chromosome segregation ATPase